MKDIRITPRNAGGWNGAHGTAYTVTAELANGKRATVRRQEFAGKCVLTAKGERFELTQEEWGQIWTDRLTRWANEHIDNEESRARFIWQAGIR